MSQIPPLFRFDAPSTILHGGGCRRQIPAIAKELGASRVLIVTDPGVVALGIADEIAGLLKDAGLEVAVFDSVQPDPTDENVQAGFASLRFHNSDLIIGLGGGSPIDAAKVIAIQGSNPGPLRDFMGLHKIPHPGRPLIAVPTTAGTGSEATKVAVITNSAQQEKMMMLSAPLMPAAAVVDFELTISMPKELTSAVGVDTLTHGIEAFVSRKANGLSDPLALQCVSLCARHLRAAWLDPANREAREGMMLAATLGGLAFSNSSVALVHGMSRPIGAVFHLPHGLSNAILLPTITRFSVSAAPDRYAAIAQTIGCARAGTSAGEACAALVGWLETLNRELELPKLSQCRGVTANQFESQVHKMVADAIASGSPANNPRQPTAEEIKTLYEAAW